MNQINYKEALIALFIKEGWEEDTEGNYRKRIGLNIFRMKFSGMMVSKQRLVGSSWQPVSTYQVYALYTRMVTQGRIES